MDSFAYFLIAVYCLVDDLLKAMLGDTRLRSRGFEPKLSDSEVITMEIVGELMGLDTDVAIFGFFRQHYASWFPMLQDRTTFARQAANLWRVKQQIQAAIADQIGAPLDDLYIVDGLPIPVCAYTRASRSRCFGGVAAFGYCAAKDQHFYGFKGHAIISSNGTIVDFDVTPANADEREAANGMLDTLRGTLLGDKGYISAAFKEDLRHRGIDLRTPARRNMARTESKDELSALCKLRRLVETVIGQLAGRLHIEKVWARDLWHATSRFVRKILAHTVGIFLNVTHGREPLHLAGLVPG
jgi:hypothetical protein